MTGKNWYEEWFSNKYYLALYSHRDDKEARDIINLIQRTIPLNHGSSILDVCCGAGRHSLELARRGYKVSGFDLSSFLISMAKESLRDSDEKTLEVKFEIKDMKDFTYDVYFDAAINVFSSFGYFETDKENFRVFGNVSNVLKYDGYFIFDYLNSEFLKKNLVRKSENFFEGEKVIQERRIEKGFVYKDIFIGNQKYTERLKLYSPGEITDALKTLQFEITNVFGDYYGNDYRESESTRMVFFSKCKVESGKQ